MIVAAATALPGCTRAPESAQTAEAPATPTLEFEKYTLPNGLEVILSEDHRLPLVAVNLWYHVGPANEDAGPHRLRAPLRAHDVPGLEARARRLALQAARGRRRQRPQRHHRLRSHQLLRDAAGQPARARRCGSSPIAWATCSTRSIRPSSPTSRTSSATSAGRASRTQPYGIVEEALFHQLFPKDASVLRQRHRLARRHPGGEARRREELLQAVLRAEQRQPRHRRRHRQGGDEGAGREVLRHAQAGAAGAEAVGADAADHRRAPRRRHRIASSCRASTWRG